MINTVHTKPLKHASTVFLIWILVATLTTSPVQAQPAPPPVADPVAQAEMQTVMQTTPFIYYRNMVQNLIRDGKHIPTP